MVNKTLNQVISLFITTHNAFVFGDPNSPVSVTIQNHTCSYEVIFSQSD